MSKLSHKKVRRFAQRELLAKGYKHAVYGIVYNNHAKHILQLATTTKDIHYFTNDTMYNNYVEYLNQHNASVLAVHATP